MTKYVCEKCGKELDAEEAPEHCGQAMKMEKGIHEHKGHSDGCGCC